MTHTSAPIALRAHSMFDLWKSAAAKQRDTMNATHKRKMNIEYWRHFRNAIRFTKYVDDETQQFMRIQCECVAFCEKETESFRSWSTQRIFCWHCGEFIGALGACCYQCVVAQNQTVDNKNEKKIDEKNRRKIELCSWGTQCVVALLFRCVPFARAECEWPLVRNIQFSLLWLVKLVNNSRKKTFEVKWTA